jgi:hypothetical protein
MLTEACKSRVVIFEFWVTVGILSVGGFRRVAVILIGESA